MAMRFDTKTKLERCGYRRWKQFDNMFSCFDTILVYDRQTDRQTDVLRQHSPRYAYASRGKNRMITRSLVLSQCQCVTDGHDAYSWVATKIDERLIENWFLFFKPCEAFNVDPCDAVSVKLWHVDWDVVGQRWFGDITRTARTDACQKRQHDLHRHHDYR